MSGEDELYLTNQPDGALVMTVGEYEIRELVRKNALSTLKVLKSCPGSSVLPDFPDDPDILGVLIAGDITDQYRFFGYGLWGIFIHGDQVGLAGLKNGSGSGIGEICYAILPEYRRQKIMTRIMLSVLEHAADAGFKTVEIRTSSDDNTASRISRSFFDSLKSAYMSKKILAGTVPARNDQTIAVDSFSLTL